MYAWGRCTNVFYCELKIFAGYLLPLFPICKTQFMLFFALQCSNSILTVIIYIEYSSCYWKTKATIIICVVCYCYKFFLLNWLAFHIKQLSFLLIRSDELLKGLFCVNSTIFFMVYNSLMEILGKLCIDTIPTLLWTHAKIIFSTCYSFLDISGRNTKFGFFYKLYISGGIFLDCSFIFKMLLF